MIEVRGRQFWAVDRQGAEFFSFCATNDLTQMGMGLSRDDAGRFFQNVDEKKAAYFETIHFSRGYARSGAVDALVHRGGGKDEADVKMGFAARMAGKQRA